MKVYMVNDSDLQKLHDQLKLAKFKENRSYKPEYNEFVDRMYAHFNYVVRCWIDNEVKKEG